MLLRLHVCTYICVREGWKIEESEAKAGLLILGNYEWYSCLLALNINEVASINYIRIRLYFNQNRKNNLKHKFQSNSVFNEIIKTLKISRLFFFFHFIYCGYI